MRRALSAEEALHSRALVTASTSGSPAWLRVPSSAHRLRALSLLGLPPCSCPCHAACFQGPISGSPTSSSWPLGLPFAPACL